MHAVLITFQSSASVEQVAEPFAAYAEGLRDVSGLILKTWIRDGETLGGFHVFSSRSDADRYLASEKVAGLTANPAFTEFVIERYDVFEDLSSRTGTPVEPISAAV